MIGDAWAPVSGRAALHSYATVRHPVHPLLADVVPYVITLVDLEEGVRLVSRIPQGRHVTLSVGMPLRCEVVHYDERFALPFFLPAEPQPS